MTVLRNTGAVPRLILTRAGDYVRLAPGCVSANIDVDMDNPVMIAWLAAGDITEVKPKPSKNLKIDKRKEQKWRNRP